MGCSESKRENCNITIDDKLLVANGDLIILKETPISASPVLYLCVFNQTL